MKKLSFTIRLLTLAFDSPQNSYNVRWGHDVVECVVVQPSIDRKIMRFMYFIENCLLSWFTECPPCDCPSKRILGIFWPLISNSFLKNERTSESSGDSAASVSQKFWSSKKVVTHNLWIRLIFDALFNQPLYWRLIRGSSFFTVPSPSRQIDTSVSCSIEILWEIIWISSWVWRVV